MWCTDTSNICERSSYLEPKIIAVKDFRRFS
eukprot:UN09705